MSLASGSRMGTIQTISESTLKERQALKTRSYIYAFLQSFPEMLLPISWKVLAGKKLAPKWMIEIRFSKRLPHDLSTIPSKGKMKEDKWVCAKNVKSFISQKALSRLCTPHYASHQDHAQNSSALNSISSQKAPRLWHPHVVWWWNLASRKRGKSWHL